MRVLTLVRQVLDAEESVRIQEGVVNLDGRKLVIDTMDEYGLEQALRIREAGTDVEVVAVAIGPARCQEVLRTALAMGADRAIHVETDIRLDVIAVSKVMAGIAQQEQAELILCGGQQADWDSQALGAATAERLNWPQVTWTNGLEVNDGSLSGKHDVDEGSETFKMPLPAVVTTQQGLNEPRYPTLPNILKAKKKEMRKDTLEQYGVTPKVKVLSEEVQVKARLNKILETKDASAAAAQLVSLLRNEARVIA
jgi:electron transfer flavoprotein beta subunit